MRKAAKRKRGQPTQEEIWDDSALLRSWQDAVDEYKFYHSIHARGENIEDVLLQAETEKAKNEAVRSSAAVNAHVSLEDGLEDGEVVEEDGLIVGDVAADAPSDTRPAGGPQLPESPRAHQTRPHYTHEGPKPASGSLDHGQTLENMKMAYWWAGYYSGMYDAQQTASQQSGK